MPTEERIEIAHGISGALKRFRGRGIDVEAMLTCEDYARDILQQCCVSGNEELRELAARFKAAQPAVTARPRTQVLRCASAAAPASSSVAPSNRSWTAPLDVFNRGGMPRG